MKKIILLLCSMAVQVALQAQTVTDYDGNIYDTIIIGGQTWLRPNLKVTHYNNGVPIPYVSDTAAWKTLTTGARCYYGNDSSAYDSVYGALYNWYVVTDTNKICPEGWHVSTNDEWQATESHLGGQFVAGGEMKEAGTLHWASPNTGATNSTGFTGLPGGMRDPINDDFRSIYENGLWWTASAYNSSMAWSTYMWYLNAGIDHNPASKKYGLSIRCVKDIGVGMGNVNYNKVKVFPNPSFNKITIETTDVSGKSHLSILNLNGREIISRQISEPKIQLDISNLPSGVYFVRLTNDKTVEVGKFIKH